MRTIIAAVVVVMVIATWVQADDKAKTPPDQAAIEKMMMEMAKLGPHHEWFKRSVGEWKTKSTVFGMGGDPELTSGTAKFTLLMDGRYLRQSYKSEYGGMPYEGIGLTGYDNAQQKYVGTWIDNFSTGIMHFEGTVDQKTGTETATSETVTPLGTMKMKMVTTFEGDDKMTFTMYMLGDDGAETKHMVIDYTRQ